MTKILIVEDDLIISRIHRATLVSGGYEVDTASDGVKALVKLEEFRPELVLLDLMMPNMDGVEVIKRIRAHEQFKQIPIVVASNFYLSDLVQKAWKAGANNCIMKIECSRAELLNIIKKALAKEGPTPILKTALAVSQNSAVSSKTPDTDPDRAKNHRLLRGDLESVRKASQSFINREQDRTAAGLEFLKFTKTLQTRAEGFGFAELAEYSRLIKDLVEELMGVAGVIQRSSLSTIAQAVDGISLLLERTQLGLTAPPAKAVVLLVDDDPISSQITSYALEKASLGVVTVRNPSRALSVIEEKNFDLIILGVDLQKITGFEVCANIRKLPAYARKPIWLIAREDSPAHRARSISSGANEFLVKPLMVKEITLKALSCLLKKDDILAKGYTLVPTAPA